MRNRITEDSPSKLMSVYDEKPIVKTLEEMIKECFLEPGPGRVVVTPDQFVYKGMLVIPKTAERASTTGTVLKVGKDTQMEFWSFADQRYLLLKPGDRIVYGTWTGVQLSFDQRPSYRILMDNEVLAILEGEATKLLDVEA